MKTILFINNHCKPNSLLGNIGHGYITTCIFAKTHKLWFIKLEFLTRLKRGPNRNSKAERKQELRHENKKAAAHIGCDQLQLDFALLDHRLSFEL